MKEAFNVLLCVTGVLLQWVRLSLKWSLGVEQKGLGSLVKHEERIQFFRSACSTFPSWPYTSIRNGALVTETWRAFEQTDHQTCHRTILSFHCFLVYKVYMMEKPWVTVSWQERGQNAVSAECCYFKGNGNRLQLAPNDGTHIFTMRVTYVWAGLRKGCQ